MTSLPITMNDEVRTALKNGKGVVALESTIITHGMPYPNNRDTALAVESAVRESGATPATIAIIDGQIHVGLNESALNHLAQTDHAMKLSRADLPMAIVKQAMGSTTVAATMILAHHVGIKVFATGGIGGVHQGAELSFDISADLQELSCTPVNVVCAGAKAILDLPKTLEVLETLGVPVLTYQQDELPAFWSRESGLSTPLRADSIKEIVNFIQTRALLELKGGTLIANPVPLSDEIPHMVMKGYIDQAITECQDAGIAGKSVTPWLLNRIMELSNGKSLATNQALIINNARVASEIALGLS